LESDGEQDRRQQVGLSEPESGQSEEIPCLPEENTDRSQGQGQKVAPAPVRPESVEKLREDQDEQYGHQQARPQPGDQR
jgi:hypothetical protein